MTTKIELIILKNLLYNEPFARKVLPFLKEEYVKERAEKLLMTGMVDYITKYNVLPTPQAIQLALEAKDGIQEDDFKEAVEILKVLENDKTNSNIQWLNDITQSWCQEKALHNAILTSIHILDDKEGKKQKLGKGAIPKILSDALAISFDPNIGHDYIVDSDARYDFYHRREQHIPFDLDYLNRITGGGLAPKTLTVFLGGPNIGKSLVLCHIAAAAVSQNYNVLYITLEMSEERIAQRIDANLLNINLKDLVELPKDTYDLKIAKLKEKVKGKLIVKEYPTATASTNNFRALLNELALKKEFKPNIIIVDYLNICTSARMKMGNNVGSYTLVKAIVEELRGLAVEQNLPIVSASQINRSGHGSSDPGLEDVAESFGTGMTADNVFAIIRSEELDALNRVMFKQLKNRDNDVNFHKRFVIGIDRAKMRLYDIDDKDQPDTSGATAGEIYKSVGKPKSSLTEKPSDIMKAIKSSMDRNTEPSTNLDKIKDWKIE